MKRGGVLSIAVSIAAIAGALLSAPVASAATLIGDYQFQGTTASVGGGPVLTGLGDPSSFQTDTVMGVSRQVLVFPEGSGLQMSPVGVGAGPYSAVTTFRFDTLSGWRRVLDPFNTTKEAGLYSHDGRLNVYGNDSGESASVLLSPNTYGTVAMVMAGLPKAYFNGAPVAQLAESFNLVNDTLRFFKDNGGLNGFEESAGAVSCIRVYSGALTDGEVAAIGASPTCAALAPSTKKKKCKKKKKKGKGKAAAKKCKKKKKKKKKK